MSGVELHDERVETNVALVSRLLAAQFPQWAALPIAPVPSAGTDNALYRLGDDLVVRLPRVGWAVAMVDKEYQWLPRLAPQLPLPVPVPLAQGVPAEGYPWNWTVCQWLDGETATVERITDSNQLAIDLARFIAALQALDASAGPAPGAHNGYRGEPLATRDANVRASIAALNGLIDDATATAVWDAALRTPNWDGPPVWFHGDLHPGNLLFLAGRLSAVIDFGLLAGGDPALDVVAAWLLFSDEARSVFRAALAVDDGTWLRARGRALSFGVGVLSYYGDTNPVLSSVARHALAEVLADFQRSGS
ncbi:MAG: aminoglycoside phosphotransferase family protein [Nitrolancea sp.]